jgi:hypothetical protein
LGGVRDLVEIATATSPGVRVTTRILLALWVSFSVAGMTAIILDQRAMDWAETALWTVSGPPCQRTAPVPLESLAPGNDPGPLSFEQAQGAFAHGGVVCAEIDRDHGRQTRPFTVCQFGSPYAVQLKTPHGEVFFKAPLARPATISFAGGEPHCVLGTNFPATLFDS